MNARLAAAIGATALMLSTAWCVGFLWFVRTAASPGGPPPMADGIAVLTGGADRIAAGLDLLRDGHGRVLLISGVGHGAALQAVLRGAGASTGQEASLLQARITLGRSAASTAGNADEIAAWATSHGVRRLIVVTASYHMRRALAEIARTAPSLVLYPNPVMPPALRGAGGLPIIRLLASEYTKFLAAQLGLTRLAPRTVPG